MSNAKLRDSWMVSFTVFYLLCYEYMLSAACCQCNWPALECILECILWAAANNYGMKHASHRISRKQQFQDGGLILLWCKNIRITF